MDSPLCRLPPEVFSNVAFYLPYLDLEHLWRTNNRKLMVSMSKNGGIRHLVFEYDGSKFAWPSSLLKNFTSLASFTAISRIPTVDLKSSLIGPKLEQILSLPRSLTKLSLSFPRAESCWIQVKSDGVLLPYLDLTSQQRITQAKYFPMSEFLPNLLSLELVGSEALVDDWVSTLPQSLTMLNLKVNNNLSDACVPRLPTHLSILMLPANTRLTGAGLDRLPLSKLVLCGKGLNPDVFLPALPSCLEDLELPLNISIATADLAKLPPSLVRLSLPMNSKIQGAGFSSLNSGLISLTTAAKLEDSDISRLPKHLTSLALNRCQKLTTEAMGYLPRTLKLFSAWQAELLTDDAIALLPKSLKYLYLDAPCVTNLCASSLPPDLIELKIQSAPLSDEFFEKLSLPYLTRLELSGAKQVSDLAILLLPPRLRYLHLPTATGLTQDCMSHIPATLETFVAWSSRGFSSVPPTLKCFYSADYSVLPNVMSAPEKS